MEIKKFTTSLEKKFSAYIADKILGKPFEEIHLKGASIIPKDFRSFASYIKELTKKEKLENQPGWIIEWKETRKFNGQRIPEKIYVSSEDDFLYIINKENFVFEYFELLNKVLNKKPELREYFAKNHEVLLQYKDDWNSIINVINYLENNNVQGLYIREINVPVHTKFLEEKQVLLFHILKFLNPEKGSIYARNLTEFLGLSKFPELRKMRWLDQNLANKYSGSITSVAFHLEQWKKVNWEVDEIWLVENLTNLQLIPKRKNALAIFAKGFALHDLKDSIILHNGKIFYWGDLDEHGYILLSQIREIYPHVTSVLMEEKTVLAHQNEMFTHYFLNKTSPSGLTEEEQMGFEILKRENGRIEQERINQEYIINYFANLIQ